jgi:hypothetical protein
MNAQQKEAIRLLKDAGVEIWVEEPKDDMPIMITFGTFQKVLAALSANWQDIESAPKDGTRILTFNITPVLDEDLKKTTLVKAISVAYWALGGWMEYPASPRYVQGQQHLFWQPAPAFPELKA